jgi:hypothetical protein
MAQRLARAKELTIQRQWLAWLIVPAGLGLCILAAFWPGLRSGFHSDDFVLITEAQLSHFDLGLFKVDPVWWFYRPFSKLVWLGMYRLWGLNGAPYHLVSLIVHWLNTLLVAALARLLTDRTRLAVGAGLLFALLPFQAESVVWLASQYDLLATCGYLAALLGLLLFWRGRQIWLYLLALLAYQISLWSKELSFTLPLMVVAVWLFMPARPRARVLAICLLPFLALLGINLLQRYLVWGSIGGYATASSDYAAFAWDHFAGTLALMLGPLHRLIFPARVVQLWMLGMSAVVIAGLMAGRNQRELLLAFAWLGLTLLPVLNIMPPGPDMQNTRQLYLPAVGFSIGLVALLDAIGERFLGGRPVVFASSVAIISLLYAAIAWVHIQPWVVAGREASHVVEELHRFVPTFPAGSRLQVAGLPDNYQGAYVLRLGFDHAYSQRYGSLFKLEQVPKLPPLAAPPDQHAPVFQVAFTFDPATARWEILRAGGVVAPELDFTATGPRQSWDLGNCSGPSEWAPAPPGGACEPGRGLKLAALDGAVDLASPALDLPIGWAEVELDLEAGDQIGADAAVQLWWSTATSGWARERSLELNLLPGRHSYILFVPPDATRQPIEHLRVVGQGLASELIVKRIDIRPIP